VPFLGPALDATDISTATNSRPEILLSKECYNFKKDVPFLPAIVHFRE
jgi:hypothetical protein